MLKLWQGFFKFEHYVSNLTLNIANHIYEQLYEQYLNETLVCLKRLVYETTM